ncbi:battenin [Anaeramoeba flamelloides]|uniref:Battenin n=1 Tax=Anaeramoeba flamelloides TaxID=1746091 RepID=A0AAV7ZFP5_9EUKA|nr:battenin [Anaeramoeba flamelloides]
MIIEKEKINNVVKTKVSGSSVNSSNYIDFNEENGIEQDIELGNIIKKTSNESETSSQISETDLLKTSKKEKKKRLRSTMKIVVSFFFFGLLNNLVYVIFLSAAEDLITEDLPKSIVLSCDVIPTVLIKITAPWYMSKIPYSIRVVMVVLFASLGCLVAGFTKTTIIKLIGVVCASISCGLGEITFLAMCAFYPNSVASWSSGTGFAGVLGSVLYLALRSFLGLSEKYSLLLCSFLPLTMLVSYFFILDRSKIKTSKQEMVNSWVETTNEHNNIHKPRMTKNKLLPNEKYNLLSDSEISLSDQGSSSENKKKKFSVLQNQKELTEKTKQEQKQEQSHIYSNSNGNDNGKEIFKENGTQEESNPQTNENKNLIDQPRKKTIEEMKFSEKINLVRPLLVYMVSLLLVYYSEYTIIIGIAPVFKWKSKLIKREDFYKIFQVIYQIGVCVSRSSIQFVKIKKVWIMAILQFFLLIFLFLVGWLMFFNYWIVFAIYSFVGLLGGATYVNAFYFIKKNTDPYYKEFSLGVASVSDSMGITISSFTSIFIETWLYKNQKS